MVYAPERLVDQAKAGFPEITTLFALPFSCLPPASSRFLLTAPLPINPRNTNHGLSLCFLHLRQLPILLEPYFLTSKTLEIGQKQS